jgi:hypothetical protein
MIRKFIILVFILFLSAYYSKTEAQNTFGQNIPEFVVVGEDTIKTLKLSDIYVYPTSIFNNPEDFEKHRKLIRDVKKTLPYAKLIYATLLETYEYIMTLPTDEERQSHLKRMEKDLYAEYFPQLKKMTLSQGKLLIKLIDRECNQSSYNLLKAFLGPLRAGFWNFFAGMFGASLKSSWEPDGRDADTERIVEMVEMGLL